MTRFLLHSHDAYGLGHFRRCSQLAAGLAAADSANDVLIVTGSPRAEAFLLPDRVDVVKLPSATKDAFGSYQPRKLSGDIEWLVRQHPNLRSPKGHDPGSNSGACSAPPGEWLTRGIRRVTEDVDHEPVLTDGGAARPARGVFGLERFFHSASSPA